MRPALLVAAAALVASACAADAPPGAGGDDPGVVIVTTTVPDTTATTDATTDGTTDAATERTTGSTTTGVPTEPSPPATGSTSTTSTTTSTTEPPAVGNPVVAAVEVGRFDRPVDLVPRAGDAALYVVQQRGQVVRWDRATGATDVALDLAGRLSTGNEQGLLGLAFSPDGSTAYVDITDAGGTTNVLAYAVLPDGGLDATSERTVITVGQPYGNHNAGDLLVDDAGLLYVTLGDGGSGGDPQRVADDPTSLLGSLLRIDPTPSGDAGYTIPADNPFASGSLTLDDGTVVRGAPEVFAWGLRNPWKIAVDPVTAELWIADVGQNEFEEVNVVGPVGGRPAGWGLDFGWSAFEGTVRFNGDVPDTGRTTPPVLTYAHTGGRCSVSGGVPYRGSAVPELAPAYVYGDFCSGEVWALDVAGSRSIPLLQGVGGLTAVRADADGELYLLQSDGPISQIVAG